MRLLKERVFSRKSGIRHLVMLILGVLVLAWTYVVLALFQEDWDWVMRIYRDISGPEQTMFFWAFIGLWIGLAAALGALVYACGKKWILRLLVKFFYCVLSAVPIVNLIVPLLYQRHIKKYGENMGSQDSPFRASIRRVTHYALVEENTIVEANGKVKLGLIRFLCVTFIQLVEGIVFLIGAIIVPVCTPVLMVAGLVAIALVADADFEVAFWIGVGAAGIAALVFVLHPAIALLLNKPQPKPQKNQTKPEPIFAEADPNACDPEPEQMPEPPTPAPEPRQAAQPQEPDQEPQAPAPEAAPSDPIAQVPETKETIQVTELNRAGEIQNYKEKDI